ncbi:hypothetical protein TrST_g3460 [Triparma strigata]|uniref:Aspartyl/asparaginy/proline hydroxylase domain-containing protein n=1 Tax=Triparma strigata TaxID=1606541 RepID=A0A9W7EYB6_9STRA|nr:hypothetical protein TrST_g3460 [Triparma strigata]
MQELTKRYCEFRDEVFEFLEGGEWRDVGEGRMTHDKRVKVGEWKEVVIFGSNEVEGLDYTKNVLKDVLPEGTVKMCEEGGGEVILSRLGGRARIKKHVGPSNLRLTCHLGVKVPEGCGIEVAGVEMGWKEGECIVFDDGYEHRVWNDSEEDRIVLLIRFWNPVVEEGEREGFLEEAKRRKEEDYRERWHPPKEEGEEWIEGIIEEGRRCAKCGVQGKEELRIGQRERFEIYCRSCGNIETRD